MNATYMDFPKVMESARKKFENVIVNTCSIEDLGSILGERKTVSPPPQPDLISFN